MRLPAADAETFVIASQEESSGSHADSIYRYLEQEIVAGRLEPGTKLDDVSLAKMFGVSKTPVREAFLQLAAIDFVQLKQRVGAIVAPLSLQRMVQMFEAMAEYEGACAAFAAVRMTSAERELLRTATDRCRALIQTDGPDASEEYTDANFTFHEIIYRGSHNDYLSEQATALRKRLAPYRRYWLTGPFRRRKSSQEHDQIAAAILVGDEESARRLTKQHLSLQTDLLAELLDKLPPSYLSAVKHSSR